MEQKERKIYLSELFKYICKNGINIVIFGVVIAIAFSIYMYKLDVDEYESKSEYDKEIISLEDLSYEETKIVEDFILLQDRSEYYQNYLENSYLMNMDVNNVKKVVLQYYIDSEYKFNISSDNEIDYTSSILEMYYMYLDNKDFMKQVMHGLKEEYINELFRIYTNVDSKMLSIYVYIPSGVDAEIVKEKITNFLKAKEKDIQIYGEHKIVTLIENVIEEHDNNLENSIYSTRKIVTDTKSQISVLKGQLNDLQQRYLKQYYNVVEEKTLIKPGFDVKNSIFGLVLGICLVSVLYIIKSILSGKLQCADDMRVMFGLTVFEHTSSEEEYIATKIKCMCEGKGINKLFFTSTLNKNVEYIDAVAEMLKKKGIEVLKGDSIMNDSSSLEDMCKIKNVILVEKMYVSKYNNIAESIQIMTDNNINIIGVIVVK